MTSSIDFYEDISCTYVMECYFLEDMAERDLLAIIKQEGKE